MATFVTARFLVDRPIRAGMVRAILDTLTAQGGAYAPHLVQRTPGEGLRRITTARPANLLDEVGEGGTRTTFMRVAEAQPQPVLTFSTSRSPRTRPTEVTLSVPPEALDSSQEIDRLLGVCKGLYLFLESFWGAAGLTPPRAPALDEPIGPGGATRGAPRKTARSTGRANERQGLDGSPCIHWANFFGPELVSRVGVARLLTSMAFIVEILPDGGVMVITHPSPVLAESPEGLAMRIELAHGMGLKVAPADGTETWDADQPARWIQGGPTHRKSTL